ncbi:MAG: multifunctional CCA addition/repair protein [Legionellales bacterium]
MKVYLVGGAVRDQLLGYPFHERDWVVVGATPEQLLTKKFKQVGRDFPVFLHPETNEEYALARTERKSAPGYYGFECNFSSSVTLEEDLARRDLTINAMAMDSQGKLIDPYQGQQDLNDKILRHVSPAFIEDPVRVLRVARFVARFHHLGFKLANETRLLMYAMVKRGELSHLVAERVWQEWQRSLEEKNPEQFILTLRACAALQVVLPEINVLFGIPSYYQCHTEMDSGIHTLKVLAAVTTLSQNTSIRFAAVVHAVGKALTPMSRWPEHLDYGNKGVPVIETLCSRLRVPNEFRILAVMVARFHLDLHKLPELDAKAIVTVLEQTDAFRRPQTFYNLLMACEACATASTAVLDYRQSKQWIRILSECAKINPQILIAQGYQGIQIKEALHLRRVACVKTLDQDA